VCGRSFSAAAGVAACVRAARGVAAGAPDRSPHALSSSAVASSALSISAGAATPRVALNAGPARGAPSVRAA